MSGLQGHVNPWMTIQLLLGLLVIIRSAGIFINTWVTGCKNASSLFNLNTGRYPVIPCLLSVCFDDAGHGRYALFYVNKGIRLTAPCRAYAVLWQIYPFLIHFDENSLHRVCSNRSWNSPLVTIVTRTWRGGCKLLIPTFILSSLPAHHTHTGGRIPLPPAFTDNPARCLWNMSMGVFAWRGSNLYIAKLGKARLWLISRESLLWLIWQVLQHVPPIIEVRVFFVFFCPPSQRSCGRGILDNPSSFRPSVHPSVRSSWITSKVTCIIYNYWIPPLLLIPYILCAGNQRRGTLSLTRMQFFFRYLNCCRPVRLVLQ